MSAREKVNILLVDDQPAKLLTYETILEPLGENLIKASSAREALEHLLKQEMAVVLVDVSMPDIDGFELAAMIRQHPRHERASIIFVSAVHMTDMDRLRGYESGGVDYVSVPIEPEILRARVSVFADLYRKTRQLERLNEELEHRVEERTRELTDAAARLRDSEEVLREVDRRKDEFLATLAHELRNPLAPIRNAVEVLRHGAGSEHELRWSYDVIDRQVEHLARLVNDLVDVGRITRGKLEIRREAADLAEVVRGAVEAMRTAIATRRLQFHMALPQAPIPVEADVVRLHQVILNLLDNAIKFTDEGGAVWLFVEHGPSEVIIRVRDTGGGIAAEELPRVFEMFYQPIVPASHVRSGLGIGLALVRRLVELHGGTIEALSPGLGQGSEFVIRLPAAERSDRRPAARRDRGRSGRPTDRALPGTPSRRVLVVDDNVDSAESLALLLRRNGNVVEVAHDGESAVKAAERFRADVILLDIGLPGMDGCETARRIRQQPWGTRVGLIAVTGWGQAKDRRRSLEAGIDAHLVKPVDPSVLADLLAHLPRPVGSPGAMDRR